MSLDPSNQYTSNPQSQWTPPDANAFVQTIKQQLGIQSDSINMPFTQLNPLYNMSGAMLGTNSSYRTASENPLLDLPLETLYTSFANLNAPQDESWQTAYQNLQNALPDEVKGPLVEDLANPFEGQEFTHVGLNNALTTAAKFLTILDNKANSPDVSALTQSQNEYNASLSLFALHNALGNNAETVTNVANSLNELTPNFTKYDDLQNILGDLKSPTSRLENIKSSIQSNGSVPDSVNNEASKASSELGAIKEKLQKIHGTSGHFQILSDNVQTLQNAADSLTLPSSQAGALYQSSNLVTLGLSMKDSATGILGPSFDKMQSFTNEIASMAMPNAFKAQLNLISNITTLSNVLAIGASSYGVQPGVEINPPKESSWGFFFALPMVLDGAFGSDSVIPIFLASAAILIALTGQTLCQTFGSFPSRDPTEIPAAHFFSFEVLLNGIVSSNVIQSYYHSLISSLGNESGAKKLAPIYSLMTLSLIVLSAVCYGRQNPEILIQQNTPAFKEGLISLKELLEKQKESKESNIAQVTVNEALESLEKQDYERLMGALSSILDMNGSSLEELTKDVNTVRGATNTVIKLLKEKSIEPTAGVMTVV